MSFVVTNTTVPLEPDGDGVVRVGNTRITLDTLVAAFHEGATAEEIVQQYPPLCLAEVYSVLAYYLAHQADVTDYLRTRQKESEATQAANESRFAPDGVRERLMRRANKA